MGQHHSHPAIFCIQTGKHMENKGIVTLGGGRNAPVKPVVGVQLSRHLLFALAVGFSFRKESTVPLIQAEWWICHHYLEFHQVVILDILGIREGISLPDSSVIHSMQEHIHGTKCPGLCIQLLAINSHLAARYLLVCFQQQAATAAGRIIDSVVFLRLHQGGDQFRNLTWGKELAAFFARI